MLIDGVYGIAVPFISVGKKTDVKIEGKKRHRSNNI